MQPIVTFAIPCYNVEHCVEHCITSIMHPDILDSVEILCINDGSTDNTSTLLHKYKDQHPDVIRVIDKENGGWGTAINLAIREAKGKYFKEIDADDWVETTNLPVYIKLLEETDCDYVATDYAEYWQNEHVLHPHTYLTQIYNRVLDMSTFWKDYPDAWGFPIHAITYRTGFIQNIDLTVGERFYGDIEYIIRTLPFIHNLIVLPVIVTIYFRGSNTQSTSTAGYKKHYRDFVALSQRLIDFYSHLPELPMQLRELITNTVYGSAIRSYELMMSTEFAGRNKGIQQELSAYDTWLKNANINIYRNCNNAKKHGIRYILFWRLFHFNILTLRVLLNKRHA